MDRGRGMKWDQVIEFHVTSPVCFLRVVQKIFRLPQKRGDSFSTVIYEETVFGIIVILLTFDMKIDAFGGRLDINTRQTKQEPVRRHSVVFKQFI
jgi:hypothetical protein